VEEEGCCVAVEEPGEFAVGGLDEGVPVRGEVLFAGVGLGGAGDDEDDVVGGEERFVLLEDA
jgi:hypothetical protein